MQWSSTDELQFAALQARRQQAITANAQAMRSTIIQALDKVLPRMDAGSVPNWPGMNAIADKVGEALALAGYAKRDAAYALNYPPGVRAGGAVGGAFIPGVPLQPVLVEAGFEGGEGAP